MTSISEPGNVDIIDVILLYEKDSGIIRHTHYVGFVQGAKNRPSKDECERRALQHAKQKESYTSELVTLHVSPTDFKPNIEYRIDPNTKMLVASSHYY